MKTNTLSNLSGVNAETIRKYRDRSLLRPACNPENGYYEYSQADFLNLLYIRKLRGANLSIDSIAGTYVCDESESLRQEYEKTLEDLQKQIRQLKRKEMMLRLTYRHYERDAASTGKISEILFTLVINIRKEFFEAESLPERIPFRIGMGTYQDVLEEEQISIPEEAAVFPEGRYVSFFLAIDNLQSFESGKLDEVRKYLKENGLQPASDTTAYLGKRPAARQRYHGLSLPRHLCRHGLSLPLLRPVTGKGKLKFKDSCSKFRDDIKNSCRAAGAFLSVFQAVERGGDAAAAGNKRGGGFAVQRDDRGRAQQTAEVHPVADRGRRSCPDQPNRHRSWPPAYPSAGRLPRRRGSSRRPPRRG